MRGFRFVSFLSALGAAAVLVAPFAGASDPFLQVLTPAELAAAPAQRYAKLTRDEAIGELRARGVLFDEVAAEGAPGCVMPVRLTGRLHGVNIHGSLGEEARTRSPFETLDARFALTLDDFAAVLERHGVDEVLHFSMYRPGGPARGARPAPALPGLMPKHRPGAHGVSRPHLTASRPAPAAVDIPSEGQTTSRHPAGLAIDVASLHKRDGAWLSVQSLFHGRIGAQTCGQGVGLPGDEGARELRAVVCEAAASRAFTYILTPNYNRDHYNHWHMEIKGGVPWVLYH